MYDVWWTDGRFIEGRYEDVQGSGCGIGQAAGVGDPRAQRKLRVRHHSGDARAFRRGNRVDGRDALSGSPSPGSRETYLRAVGARQRDRAGAEILSPARQGPERVAAGTGAVVRGAK